MNRTERNIKHFYQSINLKTPYCLSIENVANKLNLSIIYWKFPSEITLYKGIYKMFINEQLNDRQIWQDFGHEIGHFLLHEGSQSNMYNLFLNYQESQADYFAHHFCVPTFMLQNIKGVDVYKIMNLFNVEFDFALRRLEMYQNKLLNRRGNNVLQKN